MFHPLSLAIGLRYVLRRTQGFFVSFISWVSMLGICVGVAALITVLSVMNGFEGEVRERLLSMTAHASLIAAPDKLRNWPELARQAKAQPGVIGVAPYVGMQAMVGRGLDLSGATVRGVLPAMERDVSSIGDYLVSGSMDDLVPGERHILLGRGLAWTLGAQVGDELTVLIPQVLTQAGEAGGSMFDLKPRIQSFTVTGIFDTGLQDADAAIALVHMEDAAQMAGTDGAPTGLRLKFADIFAAPLGAPRVAEALGGGYEISDWSKENASYFRAVRIEKTMMTLILMLIVAVAAFNIVAALVMVVNEKRNDIAILLTLGLSPRSVVGVFMTQGVIIGWVGALLGVGLGLVLALNIDTIVPFLEQIAGRQALDPEVFAISKLPSEVRLGQVLAIAATALILSILSTIYPSLRASRTEPAEALRYE